MLARNETWSDNLLYLPKEMTNAEVLRFSIGWSEWTVYVDLRNHALNQHPRLVFALLNRLIEELANV